MVASEPGGPPEGVRVTEPSRWPGGAIGQNGDLEDHAGCLAVFVPVSHRRVDDARADGEPLQPRDAVGEDHRPAVEPRGEDHLGLGRLVVRLATTGREAARCDEEPARIADREPPGLAHVGHHRSAAAIGLDTDDAASARLGDEQPAVEIEGEPDGTLEAGGHEGACAVGREPRHGARRGVGDVQAAGPVHRDASQAPEARGQDLHRRERSDQVLARGARRRDRHHQEHERREPPEPAREAAPVDASGHGRDTHGASTGARHGPARRTPRGRPKCSPARSDVRPRPEGSSGDVHRRSGRRLGRWAVARRARARDRSLRSTPPRPGCASPRRRATGARGSTSRGSPRCRGG